MVDREKVWAVSMMRDEEDIVGQTIRQLVDEGVDGIIVANNRSVDNTGVLLEELQGILPIPLVLKVDDEPGYYQAAKMGALAAEAHEYGADWIVPFDADEIWYANGDRLAEELRLVPRGIEAVSVPMYNHFRTALDSADPRPVVSMMYRADERNQLNKVAYRWSPSAQIWPGNHGVSIDGRAPFTEKSPLMIRHFPYRSPEQMVRKAVNGLEAYRAAPELPAMLGSHWRQYGELIERYGAAQFVDDVWFKYYFKMVPVNEGMKIAPAPYLRWAGKDLKGYDC
jgi:glycosyltransferase involved in cell wall biosynthesis